MALVDLKSDLSRFRKTDKVSKYIEEIQIPHTSRVLNEERDSSLDRDTIDFSKLEGNVVNPNIKLTKSTLEDNTTNPNIKTEKQQLEGNISNPNHKTKRQKLEGIVEDPNIKIERSALDNNTTDPNTPIKNQTLEGIVEDPNTPIKNQTLEGIVEDPKTPIKQQQLDEVVEDPNIATKQQELDGIVEDPNILTKQQQLEDIVEDPGIIKTLYDQLSDLVEREDELPEIPSFTTTELSAFFSEEKQNEIYNNDGATLQDFLPPYSFARGLQKKNTIEIGEESYFSGTGGGLSQDFVRGGIAAENIAQEDAERFTKWLDTQKGKQWLILQQGLHLMNPNVETSDILGVSPTKVFNPSNLSQTIRGGYAGIRVPSIGTDSKDAFRNSYEEAIKSQSQDQNRMIKLYKELIVPDRKKYLTGVQGVAGEKGGFFKRIGGIFNKARDLIGTVQGILTGVASVFGGLETINKINNIIAGIDTVLEIAFPDEQVIRTLTGLGGPNSVLGVGQTRIYRYSNTIKDLVDLNIRRPNQGIVAGIKGLEVITRTNENPYTDLSNGPGKIDFDETSEEEYTLYNLGGGTKTFETNQNANNPYNIGSVYLDNIPSKQVQLKKADVNTPVDEYMRDVNLIPYGQHTYADLQSRDLIKFFFTGPKDSKVTAEEAFIFLANIDSFNDTITPSIDPILYLGRADPAFIYRSFLRTFDLSFKITSFNKEQMKANYKKLNYLASFTTPEYDACRMVNPFMRITIGDYFNNCPVILTGFFINITNENTWNTISTQEEKQLPFVLDVTINGYVITDKRPKKGGWFFGYEDWLDAFPEDVCPPSERPYANIAELENLEPVSTGRRFGTPTGGSSPTGQEVFDILPPGSLQGNLGSL